LQDRITLIDRNLQCFRICARTGSGLPRRRWWSCASAWTKLP
jgi:hypothetical protein